MRAIMPSSGRTRELTASHGFTLIETMIVLVILGFLTAAAMPIYGSMEQQARAAAASSAELEILFDGVLSIAVGDPCTSDSTAGVNVTVRL